MGVEGCGVSGCRGSKYVLVVNPSPMSVLGVKSPHLQLLSVNQMIVMFKPHILKHHIPELPREGIGQESCIYIYIYIYIYI